MGSCMCRREEGRGGGKTVVSRCKGGKFQVKQGCRR